MTSMHLLQPSRSIKNTIQLGLKLKFDFKQAEKTFKLHVSFLLLTLNHHVTAVDPDLLWKYWSPDSAATMGEHNIHQ
jgi:hypothetical protein